MQGERITRVNSLLTDLVISFRNDPYALESVYLSVATFNNLFTPVCDFMTVDKLAIPVVNSVASTPPFLGLALEELTSWLNQRLKQPTINKKGDRESRILICWGGGISDKADFNEAVKRFDSLSTSIYVLPLCDFGKNPNPFPHNWKILDTKLSNPEIIKEFYSSDWIEAEVSCEESLTSNKLTELPSIIHLNL
jgi:uncharacterized protein YegL